MTWTMRLLHFIILILILHHQSATFAKQPNIVLFLTDDQDLLLDGMLPMQETIRLIANEGATFTNAYVHSPICCPSRSSLLTGRFLHNVRVYNNSLTGNCNGDAWRRQSEPLSFANVLHQRRSYVTFYAGKYLNQYGRQRAIYERADEAAAAPPGYDWWYGLVGNSKYYNFTLSVNGTRVHYPNAYLTDLMNDFASDFLRFASADRPFLMVLATPAPHAPFTPAPRHSSAFPGVIAPRRLSFNRSAHDKHWIMQLPPKHLPDDVTRLDAIHRGRLQSLLAVDELVLSVMTQLAVKGVLNDTYVLFTSDNGFHIGQFGMPWDKRQPYQTDVNVPLLVRGPGVLHKRLISDAVSLVDIAPSILEMAGIIDDAALAMDGQSFVPLLADDARATPNAVERAADDARPSTNAAERAIYVSYAGEANAATVAPECNFSPTDAASLSECSPANWCKCQDARNNTYDCVLRAAFKYCAFADGAVEAYDLSADAHEAHNVRARLAPETHDYYRRVLRHLSMCAGTTCRQLPPMERRQ